MSHHKQPNWVRVQTLPASPNIWVDTEQYAWTQYCFEDETGQFNGTYLTLEEAKAQLEHYNKYALGN